MQYRHVVQISADSPHTSRWGSLPLALRVGMLLAVAALVLPIAGTLLASRASRRTVESQVYDGQQVAVAGVLGRLSVAYDAAVKTAVGVAERSAVTSAVLGHDAAAATEIVGDARGLGPFGAVAIYDATGARLAALPPGEPPPDWVPPTEQTQVSVPEIVDGIACVTVRAAIRDGGTMIGELAAEIPFRELAGGKAGLHVATGFDVAIVDPNGVILASPRDGTEGLRVSAPEALALIRGGRAATDSYLVPRVNYTVLATFVPADGEPWGALASSPRDVVLADATHLGRRMLVGGAAMSLLALAITAVISTYVGAAEGRLRRARAELASRNAELVAANADIGVYANAAAHDLKSPLVTIRGIAELTPRLEGETFSERGRENMRAIEQQTDRLFALIDAMLRYARVGTGELTTTTVDLGELVSSVVEGLEGLLQLGRGAVAIGPLPTVEGDLVLLAQVFQNLIANGLVYGDHDDPAVTVQGEVRDRVVRVTVADNGPGVDPAERERIFEMFSRGTASNGIDGTGIGLAIARRIAERHGGSLEVIDDASVRGATFRLTLPA